MLRISLLQFLFTVSLANAQERPGPDAFADVITPGDLRTHLYRVASKEFESRETGTEGQRKAAVYIEEQFRNLGLLPGNKTGYQLYYPLFQDSLIKAAVQVNGSGTISVLQLAKAFAKARAEGKGPRRSILFLANSGEEKGLWGSEYYITSHARECPSSFISMGYIRTITSLRTRRIRSITT